MSLVRTCAATLAAALAMATGVAAHATTIVEYYHRDLDHYFVTGLAGEIAALDSGRFEGWARTGFSFETFAPGDSRAAEAVPVCRFYGNPAAGLDSHFYTAHAAECTAVRETWPDQWLLESEDVFRVHHVNPTTGQCPANTKPVYRMWNKRADVNHRYASDASIVETMLAKGYVLEGSGSPQRPIAFCAADIPPAQPAAGSPACAITASTPFPTTGTPVTLTATCTNAPTTYAWANCTGTGNTCVATATAVGRVSYSLVASNARGIGAPARIDLDWQVAASAVPSCSVVASSAALPLGSALTLSANCSQTPSQFQWMACSALLTTVCNVVSECASTSPTCHPVGRQVGPVYYALVASNSAGAGAKVGIGVEWTGTSGGGSTPPPPTSPIPYCTITPSPASPATGQTLTLTASCTNSPISYAWTGCSSASSTCTTVENSAVLRNYTVTASNSAGTGVPAQVTVAWQSPATAPPVCSVSANTSTPYVGGTVTLTANCTQSPASYQWTNCSSTTATCTATSSQTGSAMYSVTAANQFGSSAAASTSVTWGAPPAGGADYCGQYPDVLRVTLPWGGVLDTRSEGGMRPGTIVVARLRVPANAPSGVGGVRFYEYIDGQAQRQLTVSTSACDFRGFVPGGASRTDPTSSSAPMAWSNDINPAVFYDVLGAGALPRLIPGQTYYFNLRNVNWVTGTGSCSTATCDGRFNVATPN